MNVPSRIILCILFLYSICIPVGAQWVNGQEAEHVVGQPDYGSYILTASVNSFKAVRGVALDIAHGKLYVADGGGNRVLRFSYPLTGNQPDAEIVFGQPDFTSASYGSAAYELNGPRGMTVHNGDLWIADAGNNRVLKFSRAWEINTNRPNADCVLGQSQFFHSGYATSQTQFSYPNDVCFDGQDNLWVADKNNHRVLKFSNADSKTSGAPADGILGNSVYNTVLSTHTAATFTSAEAVCFNGNSLWITDAGRVLRFDNPASKPDGAPADGVIGQPGLESSPWSTAIANSGIVSVPAGLASDNGGRLYISDNQFNRVLIFNNASASDNGPAAAFVLGFSDFTSKSQYGSRTRSGLAGPSKMTVDDVNGKLLIADDWNNRVVQYSAAGALPVELTSFTLQVNATDVELYWETASELDNYGFEIERRASGYPGWVKAGFVAGHGNSHCRQSYSFRDVNLRKGKYDYRLKQIDNNGMYEYSSEIHTEVAVPEKTELMQNYPNPFNPSTKIYYSLDKTGYAKLSVFDQLGQLVSVLDEGILEAGMHSSVFNAAGLSSGLYIITLTTQQCNMSIKALYIR